MLLHPSHPLQLVSNLLLSNVLGNLALAVVGFFPLPLLASRYIRVLAATVLTKAADSLERWGQAMHTCNMVLDSSDVGMQRYLIRQSIAHGIQRRAVGGRGTSSTVFFLDMGHTCHTSAMHTMSQASLLLSFLHCMLCTRPASCTATKSPTTTCHR
jgi:hypothetical protein